MHTTSRYKSILAHNQSVIPSGSYSDIGNRKRADNAAKRSAVRNRLFQVIVPISDLDYGYDDCIGINLGACRSRDGKPEVMLLIPTSGKNFDIVSFLFENVKLADQQFK